MVSAAVEDGESKPLAFTLSSNSAGPLNERMSFATTVVSEGQGNERKDDKL